MIFRMGRQDLKTEGEASDALAITDDSHENAVQASKFGTLGLSATMFQNKLKVAE